MSLVAITGATGFIGRRLVPRLLDDGHTVRALIRPVSYARPLRGKAELAYGDVRGPETLSAFLKDAEILVHLASNFAPGGDVNGTIAEGTGNVVSAAREAGVGRVVFLSCLGADAASQSPFHAAKWKAEQFVRGSELPYVILRPSLVLGRGDNVTSPLADLIRALPVVPLPRPGLERQQPIDVDDLARCVAEAVRREDLLNQEVSLGGPKYLSLRHLVDLIQGQVGVAKPKVLLPTSWLSSVVRVMPPSARELFSGSRLQGFEHATTSSPGIVHRVFGFEPESVAGRLGEYLG